MKRLLPFFLIAFVAAGLGFVGGLFYASGSQLVVHAEADNGAWWLAGQIFIDSDSAEFNREEALGRDLASAMCATQSELDGFSNTYVLFGDASAFRFSCTEPGKVTQ